MTWKTELFFKPEDEDNSLMNKEQQLKDFLNQERIEEFTILTSNNEYIEIIYKVNN